MTRSPSGVFGRNVLCMKWGTRYGPHYANRLYGMVRRCLDGDFRFICLTDDPSGLRSEIEFRPIPDLGLPAGAERWAWPKLAVFHSSLNDLYGDCLFLDLDIVILKPIDSLFEFAPGPFCIIEDWVRPFRRVIAPRPGIGNSSVFRFPAGGMTRIIDDFLAGRSAILAQYRNEQRYLSAWAGEARVWWPRNWIVSFKRHCLPPYAMRAFRGIDPPADARVVVFHGEPKPCAVAAGSWAGAWGASSRAPWVERAWRE